MPLPSRPEIGSVRRLLLVHAHPDDETITTGATMARYADEGVQVTLLTCTRGEQGEVIPAGLAHLAADRDDALGDYRTGELGAAMAALGVTDHRFLGDGGYRDSGMSIDAQGSVVPAADVRPDAFALAEVDEAAGVLGAVIEQLRPHVVVTYDPGGGYGHPDHVQAHRVTMRAVELAARSWRVPKLYWVVSPDQPATSVVDGTAFLDRKIAALRAHATQIVVDDASFALSNGIQQPIQAVEFYRLVRGEPAGPRDGDGYETDLFAGIASTADG